MTVGAQALTGSLWPIQIVNDDVAAWDAVHATITADLTPVTAQEVQHENQTAREFYGAPGQAGNESLGMHFHLYHFGDSLTSVVAM